MARSAGDQSVPRGILAFDTALSACGVAFWDAEKDVMHGRCTPMVRGQAEALVPMIDDIIHADAGQSMDRIDLIVTTVGPGAFTGLRIGLSTARALGVALDVPVAGLCTADMIAAAFFASGQGMQADRLAVLLETKRQDFYVRFYTPDGTPDGDVQALPGADIVARSAGEKILLIGDALARFQADHDDDRFTVCEGFDLIDPRIMAREGRRLYCADSHLAPEPLYLRDADVSAPKRQGRQII